MDIVEAQQYIDNKDWQELSLQEEFSGILHYKPNYDQLTYDKDFFTDFLMVPKYLERVIHNSYSLYPFDIIKYSIQKAGGILSVSEMEQFLTVILDDLTMSMYEHLIDGKRSKFNNFAEFTDKPVEFIKAMLANNAALYKRTLKIVQDGEITFGRWEIFSEGIITQLSEEERKLFIKYYSYENRQGRINFNNWEEAIEIFGGHIKLLDLALDPTNETISSVDAEDILENVNIEEFLKIFKHYEPEIKEDDYKAQNKYIRLLAWTNKNNEDKYLEDEWFEKFIKLFSGQRTSLANYLSKVAIKEQFMKFTNLFDIHEAAESDKLSLSELADLYGKSTTDLSGKRFYTEEEILEFPYFFDPESIRDQNRLYVSKDTYRIVNKAWGRRFRYNNDLTNFDKLIGKIYNKDLTVETVKYLKEKTGVSNKQVLASLSKQGWVGEKDTMHDKIKNMLNVWRIYRK